MTDRKPPPLQAGEKEAPTAETGKEEVTLRPMNEVEFQQFLEREIPRRAQRWAARGIWTEAGALEASRAHYATALPDGPKTPGHHLALIRAQSQSDPVGEVWHEAKSNGGKVHFEINWLWIEPRYRRRGYATATFRRLEEEARRRGADHSGLFVFMDNPNAMALYTKLGYNATGLYMVKSLKEG